MSKSDPVFSEHLPVPGCNGYTASVYAISGEGQEKRVVFSYGVQPLSFYFSMTPDQALSMALKLVELSCSLAEPKVSP